MVLSKKGTLPPLYLKCFYEPCGIYFRYEGGKRRMYCSRYHKFAAYAARKALAEKAAT
jgi:hypothetical protein